jgi:hypothetical protein
MIDRPESRVSARPPSAAGRRGSSSFSPAYPSYHNAGVGLHVQGSALAPYQARGNPWAAFVQARGGLRSRSSRQVLREQSSVATLRAAGSRVNLRDGANAPQATVPQASRLNLRPQPSRRQLNNQASTRTLRASEQGRAPPSPSVTTQNVNQAAARPIRLSPDERDTRARELIETRRRALGQPNAVPAATNPFHRRAADPTNPTAAQRSAGVQHSRSNSNESMQSVNSSGTISVAPTSPALGRRRSNRNMVTGPPPGVLPPAQGTYTSPVTAYGNSYYRHRQCVRVSPEHRHESHGTNDSWPSYLGSMPSACECLLRRAILKEIHLGAVFTSILYLESLLSSIHATGFSFTFATCLSGFIHNHCLSAA